MNPEDKTGWRTVAMFELLVLIVFVGVWIIREASHGEELQSAYERASHERCPDPTPEEILAMAAQLRAERTADFVMD